MSTAQFTKEEVAKHNTFNDCWMTINGRVYDVTGFLAEHPAGSKIMMMHAGKDCTKSFLEVHSEHYLDSFIPHAFVGVVTGSGATIPPSALAKMPKRFDENSVLTMRRTIFLPEHEKFRQEFRSALRQHVLPFYAQWEMQGQCDQKVYRKLCELGFYLRFNIPKQFGGLGITDYRYNSVIVEETEYMDVGSFSISLGNDVVLSYFTKNCTPAQRAVWLPKISAEGKILAVAMSEPELGSDLGSLSCRAVKSADGTYFTLTGRKMWISAGSVCDYVVVSAVTDPKEKYRGISLLVVERGMPGFSTAKRLGKLGRHASDTCLLTFEDVRVPASNLIGNEGFGFFYMMQNLPQERLSIAIASMAAARRALALTTNYAHGRRAFGGVIGDFQTVQFTLARLRCEVQSATAFIDQCVTIMNEPLSAAQRRAGDLYALNAETASLAKVHATELAFRVANECLQIFGGYGYLKNAPIGKILADQRVTRIYGGANEIMLEIIAKGLGFMPQRPAPPRKTKAAASKL